MPGRPAGRSPDGPRNLPARRRHRCSASAALRAALVRHGACMALLRGFCSACAALAEHFVQGLKASTALPQHFSNVSAALEGFYGTRAETCIALLQRFSEASTVLRQHFYSASKAYIPASRAPLKLLQHFQAFYITFKASTALVLQHF